MNIDFKSPWVIGGGLLLGAIALLSRGGGGGGGGTAAALQSQAVASQQDTALGSQSISAATERQGMNLNALTQLAQLKAQVLMSKQAGRDSILTEMIHADSDRSQASKMLAGDITSKASSIKASAQNEVYRQQFNAMMTGSGGGGGNKTVDIISQLAGAASSLFGSIF